MYESFDRRDIKRELVMSFGRTEATFRGESLAHENISADGVEAGTIRISADPLNLPEISR